MSGWLTFRITGLFGRYRSFPMILPRIPKVMTKRSSRIISSTFEYEIELKFKAGLYRIAGIIISLVSIGMMLLILLREDVRFWGHSNRRII